MLQIVTTCDVINVDITIRYSSRLAYTGIAPKMGGSLYSFLETEQAISLLGGYVFPIIF